MPFDANNVVDVEFGVALRNVNPPCYIVPSEPEVRLMLTDMLRSTISSMNNIGQAEEIEYGEGYPGETHLTCKIDDDTVAEVAALFQSAPQTAARALDEPRNVDFYFARFKDNANQRCMGVKTPTQFKAGLKKRWITVMNDQLRVVEDTIFKLDTEFDFIVYDDRVDIFKPAQFMRVAKVDAVLAAKAPLHINEIATMMALVDFTSTTEYTRTRSRAQKLVASIRKRTALNLVTDTNLRRICALNNINLVEENGKLKPDSGHEMDFLELLDGRRYLYPFDECPPELLRALSRKQVKP